MFGYDLGIDLGTNSIVISVVGKGVVLSLPMLHTIAIRAKCFMPASVHITLRVESRSV